MSTVSHGHSRLYLLMPNRMVCVTEQVSLDWAMPDDFQVAYGGLVLLVPTCLPLDGFRSPALKYWFQHFRAPGVGLTEFCALY